MPLTVCCLLVFFLGFQEVAAAPLEPLKEHWKTRGITFADIKSLTNNHVNLLLNSRVDSLREDSYLVVRSLGTKKKTRPIIFMHGLFGDKAEMDFINEFIPKKLPDVQIYFIDLFIEYLSVISLKSQVAFILPAMQKIMDAHSETGVTLLCYSQGGVICRAAVQMLKNHNVHTMIALSSPLNGQFGITNYVDRFLPDKEREYLWELFYSGAGQDISIASYWRDPHHIESFSNPSLDILLARLNNETGHRHSKEYKANFLRLKRFVMVGGPDDDVITPWQSALMGFYGQDETVFPMEQEKWYKTDAFGMRTLNEAGRVFRHVVNGVGHTSWYRTQKVFECCVLPYL